MSLVIVYKVIRGAHKQCVGIRDTLEIMVSPEPSRDIFVSRLHSDINSDKLINYLKLKNIVTRNVEC